MKPQRRRSDAVPPGLEAHPRWAVLALGAAPGLAMAGDPAGWPALTALCLGGGLLALCRSGWRSVDSPPMG